jgi:hypothetical protein
LLDDPLRMLFSIEQESASSVRGFLLQKGGEKAMDDICLDCQEEVFKEKLLHLLTHINVGRRLELLEEITGWVEEEVAEGEPKE